MSQIEQISALPVPAPTYTNDAYMAVFNRFTLEERLALRLVCHRWRDVIEEDCAQMTVLRIFGNREHKTRFNRRMIHREVKPPTVEDGLEWDPNPGNMIILNRPAYDRVDIQFLARLFPAVQNLALTWNFGEEIVETVKTMKKDETDQIKQLNEASKWELKFNSIIEPDIFDLLSTWAPNLRQFYFDTLSYTFKPPYWAIPDNGGYNDIDARHIPRFWNCLTMMAPTLENFTFQGVNIETAPESLVLPSLIELSYYIYQNDTKMEWASPFFKDSPARLQQLAPVLKTLRLEDTNCFIWQLPSTITRLNFILNAPTKKGVPPQETICPSVTHLEIELDDEFRELGLVNNCFADSLIYFSKKYPSVKVLKVLENSHPGDFNSFLSNFDYGDDWKGVTGRPRQAVAPFGAIEELHIVTANNFVDIEDWEVAGEALDDVYEDFGHVNYEAVFEGIATAFGGLKKLVISVGPAEEETHQFYHERFIELRAQYLPQVELTFALNIFDGLTRQYGHTEEPDYEDDTIRCYLSPGCVFLKQEDTPEAEMSGPKKKKQRTE